MIGQQVGKKNRFKMKAFISLVTIFLGAGVLVSGIVLLIMPDPTLAYWNRWTFLNMEKIPWETFHGAVSIYFTIVIGYHIYENWKPLVSYFKAKVHHGVKQRRELIWATVLSTIIIVGSFTESPIAEIVEVFEPVSESWYSTEHEPPFEDAQGLPLELLIKVQDLDGEKVGSTLKALNITYSLGESLEEISEKSDKTPSEIYNAFAE